MKVSIEINKPRDKVIELFSDKNNFKEWKKEFIRYEHINGTPGEPGAVTKLVFKRVILFETILSKTLPGEICEEYEHKRGDKTVMFHKATNRFTTLSGNRTLFESDMEVTKVIGFLPKIVMKLMSGAARKYAQDQLDQFKKFAKKSNINH